MKRSNFITEAFNKPGSRNIRLALSLLFIAMATIIIMTIFSVAKVLFNPDITLWETHLYTIIFTGIVAPAIALFVLLKFEGLYTKISKENEERKRAEEALYTSEERYRRLFETMQENFSLVEVITDERGHPVDYRFLDVNPALERYSGCSREQLVGRKHSDLMAAGGGAAEQKWFDIICSVGLTGKEESGEHYAVSTGCWAQFYAFSPRHGQCAVISMDITERRRAEEALRESEEKSRKFFDMPLIGAAITSPEKRFIQVNDKLCEMFGYSREELLQTSWDKITHPEDLQKNFWAFGRLTAGEIETYTFEKRFIHKNGSIVYVILSAGCVHVADRRVDYFVSVYEDITSRKLGEIALQEAKDQADIYLDLMGHDINNMNQIALGYLELADEMFKGNEARELISKPLDAIKSSSNLIESVRTIQRSKAHGLRIEAIDLNDVLSELKIQYLKVPDREIDIELTPSPDAVIMANGLIKDVFSNLIGNAIKHSDGDKPVHINIRLERIMEGGSLCIKVSIEDNGPGIPNELKNKLFARFQRGNTKATGKGLGLYLVKTLVDDFHGRVWAEDRVPGDHTKGSRFVVILPAV